MVTIAGDVMDNKSKTLGHTLNMRILFENRASTPFILQYSFFTCRDQIFTTEPEYTKVSST